MSLKQHTNQYLKWNKRAGVLFFACLLIPLFLALILSSNQWLQLLFDLHSQTNQKALVVCISVYLLWLLIADWWVRRQLMAEICKHDMHRFASNDVSRLLLLVIVILSVCSFFLRQTTKYAAAEFCEFFLGIIVARGIMLASLWFRSYFFLISFRMILIGSFICLLVLASVFHFDEEGRFYYHGEVRRCGLWENPNIFGLLMGVGLTMAIGCLIWKSFTGKKTKLGIWHKYMTVFNILWLISFILLTNALVKSYSRGAWLASICGLAYFYYIIFAYKSSQDPGKTMLSEHIRVRVQKRKMIRTIIVILVVTVCAIRVTLFHQDYNYKFAKRVSSIADPNDMSWVNRVITSEGALQMISVKPWLGYGWNQPENIYNEYFKPSRLVDGRGIILNSYLMLTMILGLPVLVCLLVYCYIKFMSGHRLLFNQNSKIFIMEGAICRAGCIVLFTGFIFNGGMLYLPLAAPAWILLEFGSFEF